jgi:acetyltransferase-like isoleucine patch superfamily enzyme
MPFVTVARAFLLKIRRSETPFYVHLKRIVTWVLYPELPVPRPMLALVRGAYHLHWIIWRAFRWIVSVFYAAPLFRGRCASMGKHCRVFILPHVVGHTRIHIGNDVQINGQIGISSGRVHDDPVLIIKDRVVIGHQVLFSVNQEIVIDEDVYIAGGCRISDNDGHPRDMKERLSGMPPPRDDIKPVRICRGAWLGEGCYIRKGVTIGEGAIIGSGSVILKDVPPYAIAMGNVARVVGFTAPPGQPATAGDASEV